MAILLKIASVRVSSIKIIQVRVQNKGKSVWKSRYDGDVSGRRRFGVRGRGRIRHFGVTALVKGKVDTWLDAAENTASVAGSIHPSMDGALAPN